MNLTHPPSGAAEAMLVEAWRQGPIATDERRADRNFQLAYVSSGRRAYQRIFQPAWVAVLNPKARFGTGKVVTVPDTPTPFGPVVEPVRPSRGVARTPA